MNIKYFNQGIVILFCFLLPINFAHSHEVKNFHKEYDWDAWDVIPGEVLIKYTPQKSRAIKAKTAASGISGLTLKPIHESIEQEFKKKNHSKKFIALLPDTFIGYFDPANRKEVLAALASDPNIIYFEPNRRRIASPNWGTATPNDPQFGNQWGMPRIGADQVWPQQPAPGAPAAIRVAVMEADGPFDNAHPDLTTQVSAVQNDNRADTNHGTMVSGIVAATGNNATDVVGVANVELVGLDFGNSDSDFANAVTWAVNNGIDVINMSWKWCGSGGCGTCSYPDPSNTVQDAIINSQGNIVFVAAAANDSCNSDASGRRPLPTSYRGVIGVSALDQANNRAGFSNFGPYVDLTAPGVNIISTEPWDGSNWTDWGDGTSYSAPHVSGSAAAVLVIDNNFDTESINQLLELTAEDIGAAERDNDFGCGVVRVDRAVNAIADNYVQLGGRDGDGTLAAPFETINDGVNNTPNNRTLGLVRGSYNTAITLNKPLTLISVGGNVTIGGGTYYKTPTRSAFGSDSVSIPSGSWPQGPGMAGFYFDFLSEDHHIEELRVVLDTNSVTAGFNDNDDNDEFRWFAAGHSLPAGTTYGNVSGTASGAYAESGVLSGSGVFVITGFELGFLNADHHLEEVAIEFFDSGSGPQVRVFFNDDDDNDSFSYIVHYAVVPSGNVAAQGSISSAIVMYEKERISCLPENAVIQNFHLQFSDHDHHIDELGVDLSPGRVWYNDKNDDDGFSWFVDWVELQ